jgi:hypothetical protein
MTKGRAALFFIFGLQISNTADLSTKLGTRKGRVALPFRFDTEDDEQQVPPLRYAPVGMTLLLGTEK